MTTNIWVKRLLTDTQAILSASYALLIMLGGMFDYFYYKKFGIDILSYSSILDLLVEPFRKPIIMIFFIGTLILVYSIHRFDIYWQNRFPHSYKKLSLGIDSKPWYGTYRKVMFFSIVVYYTFLSATVFAVIQFNAWKKNSYITRICFNLNDCVNGKIIGTNSNYLFAKVGGKVQVIPINSQLAFWEKDFLKADSTIIDKP